MPRSTTRQQTQEQDTQVDVLPPPDDDVDPAPHDATGRPDDEGHAVAPPRGQDRREPPQPEDRLAEITQLYRAARDKAKATAVDSDTEGDDGADDAQGKVGEVDDGESLRANQPDNGAKNAPPPPAGNVNQNDNQQPEDPVTTLKVDGVELQLPLSKVKELAQKNLAGQNRLEEAKRILSDAKAFRDQGVDPTYQRAAPEQGQNSSQTPSQTDPASAPGTTNQSDDLGIDRAKLEEVVERIQVGDKDEGVQAVTELVRLISANRPALDEQSVFRLAQQAIVQQQIDNEIKTAVERFTKEYEPIVSNKYRLAAAMARLTDEMVADLRSAGVPDQDLASVRNDPRTLGHWLAYARAQGRQVRPYGQLLNDVGNYIAEQFNVDLSQRQNPPAGSQQNQQQNATDVSQIRADRKRALQTQPRSASMRMQVPAPNRPRTATEVVLEMRKQRGFAV